MLDESAKVAEVHVRPSREISVKDTALPGLVPTAEKRVPFHVIEVNEFSVIPVGSLGSVGVVQVIPSREVVTVALNPFEKVIFPTATHRYPLHATE
jgi:hypothetical protein